MGEVLIKAENVSKKFAKDLKKSLYYGLTDVFSGLTRNKKLKTLRKDEFWSVKDVSFEVRRGECLGLIGHNGAGKSTLLKVLNGLIAPDEGTIKMYGKVGALIELGAGFNPILTGRENIYNNGAVIGFSKQEINAKLEKIIAFAELEEFIDMPVQNYSSGMKVRLGFAIVAQMEPDILLIDEVLAVGDLGFILKCFKRIDIILPNTAIIFVSHSMPMVSRICNEIILMDHGKVLFQGREVSKGIDAYYDRFKSTDGKNVVFTDNSLELVNAYVLNKNPTEDYYELHWNESITCVFETKVLKDMKKPLISFALYDHEQRGIAEAIPSGQILEKSFLKDEIIQHKVQFNGLILSKGLYNLTLTFTVKRKGEPLYKIHQALNLKVTDSEQIWTPFLLDTKSVE
jgi:lipopolysaccharide transport system ATP-binding protein